MERPKVRIRMHDYDHIWREFYKTAYRSYGDRSNVLYDEEKYSSFAEVIAEEADQMLAEFNKRFDVEIIPPCGYSPKLVKRNDSFETVSTLPKVQQENLPQRDEPPQGDSEGVRFVREGDDPNGPEIVRLQVGRVYKCIDPDPEWNEHEFILLGYRGENDTLQMTLFDCETQDVDNYDVYGGYKVTLAMFPHRLPKLMEHYEIQKWLSKQAKEVKRD